MRHYLWVVPVLGAVALYFALRGLFDYLPSEHLDLQVYRYGVQAWWHGGDMYGVLPPVANGDRLPFIYPPFAALLLSPLVILPWDAAVSLLFTVNVAGLAVTLYLFAVRLWPRAGRLGGIAIASVALPLTVLFEPVIDTFWFGQVSIIVMALVAIDCLAGRTIWPRGVGIGLAASLKLFPAAFVIYFLLRRDFRSAIVAVSTFAASVVIGFIAAPGESVRYWFGGFAGAADVSGSPFHTNQAIEAVLVRTGMPDVASKASWLVISLALLVAVAVALRRTEPALGLLATAGLILLTSPTSWSHYWVWVLPGLLVMLAYAVRRGRERRFVAVSGWVVALVAAALMFQFPQFRDLAPEPFPQGSAPYTLTEQVKTAAYVLVGLPLLLAYALPRLRASSRPDLSRTGAAN